MKVLKSTKREGIFVLRSDECDGCFLDRIEAVRLTTQTAKSIKNQNVIIGNADIFIMRNISFSAAQSMWISLIVAGHCF